MTGDRELAEELAQEAFIRVWPRFSQLRDDNAAPAYLRKALVNLAKRSVQRRLLELRHRYAPAVVAGCFPPGLCFDLIAGADGPIRHVAVPPGCASASTGSHNRVQLPVVRHAFELVRSTVLEGDT